MYLRLLWGNAGPSSPTSPVGSFHGSGIGSPRSRSRSPLASGSDDDDKEESDESVNYRQRGPADKSISKMVAREVRRALLKQKGEGKGVMEGVLEQFLAQERRVASLENQSRQIAGESSLI